MPSDGELPYNYWVSALGDAIAAEDHTVELTTANHGIQVTIDGTPAFDDVSYDFETFAAFNRDEYWDYLTDEMQDLLQEVASDG